MKIFKMRRHISRYGIQCNGFYPPYNINNVNGIKKIKHNKQIDFELELPELKLYPKVAWTDLLTSNVLGLSSMLICSEKLFESLHKYLHKYNFFEIKVSNSERTETRKYILLHIYGIDNQYINYNNSSFFSHGLAVFEMRRYNYYPIKIKMN